MSPEGGWRRRGAVWAGGPWRTIRGWRVHRRELTAVDLDEIALVMAGFRPCGSSFGCLVRVGTFGESRQREWVDLDVENANFLAAPLNLAEGVTVW